MCGFHHFRYDLDGKEAFVACANTLFKDVWPCKDEKEEKFPSYEPKSESLSLKKSSAKRVDVGSEPFGKHEFCIFMNVKCG